MLKNFSRAEDVVSLIVDLEDPTNVFEGKMPTELSTEDQNSKVKMKVWEMRLKRYLDREDVLTENINRLYGIMIGQCTPSLLSTMRGDQDYDSKSRQFDTLWLLNKTKKVTAGVDTKANPALSLHEQLITFFTTRQGQSESDDDYLNRFNARLQNLELAGGKHMMYSPELIGIENPSGEEIKQERERFKAMCFILRADEGRYGELLDELKKGVYKGRDEYPTTVSDAYELLIRTSKQFGQTPRRVGRQSYRPRAGGRGPNFMFAQHGGRGGQGDHVENENQLVTPGRNGETHETVRCYGCRGMGHFAGQCPRQNGVNLAQIGVMLAQKHNEIKNSWVLLDTCSTNSVSNDTSMVTNIVNCDKKNVLTLATNGGHKTFLKQADLKLFPMKVHFNKNSMATILSFKQVADLPGVIITTDTSKERSMIVTLKDGTVFKFKECASGLYYFDTDKSSDEVAIVNNTRSNVTEYTMLQTVKGNQEFLSKNEIARANKARRYQSLLYWPSTPAFISIVKDNLTNNCDITVDDIRRAEYIHGPAEPLLKGKMKRRHPDAHSKLTKVPLPLLVSKLHKDLIMYIDIFYVNGTPFFLSKTGKINFLSATVLKSRSAKQILGALTRDCNKHEARGFEITDIHGDNEFDIQSLKDSLQPTIFHIYARGEHVGFIENAVKTIKERARSTCHSTPYRRYTKLMTQSLIAGVIDIINFFPSKNAVSDTMSPAMLVEGKQKMDLSKKRIEFGAYAMVHVGTNNNMKRRSVPGIALRASNESGGYFFMSLYTGKQLHSYIWEELPISEEVIERVELMAQEEEQPLHDNSHPLFEWFPGFEVEEPDEIQEENILVDQEMVIDEQEENGVDEEHPPVIDNYITETETSFEENSTSIENESLEDLRSDFEYF